jgi:DNA-binding NarL/FixJ family response regulator
METLNNPRLDNLSTPLSTFIGREREIAVVKQLLSAESTQSEKKKFGGLTAHEREVAALIAQGKSNREIAKAMTVGAKTVETYVTRILNKLGFDSRVQIATWAIEQRIALSDKS